MRADGKRLLGLLEAWEAEWRRQGANIATVLRPGLSNAQIDRLTGPLDLSLPLEARVWWRWHDGTDRIPGRWSDVGSLLLLGLEEAVQVRQRMLSISATMDDHPLAAPEGLWPVGWIPIGEFGNGDVAAIDCAVPEGEVTPVRRVGWDVEDFKKPRLGSLTELVQMYLDLTTSGIYSWDVEEDRWKRDSDRMPEQYRRTRLA